MQAPNPRDLSSVTYSTVSTVKELRYRLSYKYMQVIILYMVIVYGTLLISTFFSTL